MREWKGTNHTSSKRAAVSAEIREKSRITCKSAKHRKSSKSLKGIRWNSHLLGRPALAATCLSGGRESWCLAFFGHLKKGDSRALNGDTVFEIGLVTKVFTSLLLSEMVQNGQHALSDRVAKYLPETVKLPDKDGRLTFVTGEQGRASEGIVHEAGSKCTRRGLSERGSVLGDILHQIRH